MPIRDTEFADDFNVGFGEIQVAAVEPQQSPRKEYLLQKKKELEFVIQGLRERVERLEERKKKVKLEYRDYGERIFETYDIINEFGR